MGIYVDARQEDEYIANVRFGLILNIKVFITANSQNVKSSK